jgi:alpha-beta hydrolase superfamily lysophospholipase
MSTGAELPVAIIAGTAIRGVAATLMMTRVLQRHPNAFLVTLANYGVTLPLRRSQHHLHADIVAGLEQRQRGPDEPFVIVGHSQGGLAAMRYAIDHPAAAHVVTVGVPWHGAVSAGNVVRVLGRRRALVPALRDMMPGSPYLEALHEDVPRIADRLTNLYSTHELFIRPYPRAHIDVPGVANVLIASEEEYYAHLRAHPELDLDDVIHASVNHLSEMNSPLVRRKIWATVDDVALRLADGGLATTG